MSTPAEALIEAATGGLNEILKPFQKEVNRRQRLADFVQQCIRSAQRDDFFRLDELLKSGTAADAEAELPGSKAHFDRLRTYADEQVEHYRVAFIEDLTTRAADAGLPMEVDFPRFSVLKGIEGAPSTSPGARPSSTTRR